MQHGFHAVPRLSGGLSQGSILPSRRPPPPLLPSLTVKHSQGPTSLVVRQGQLEPQSPKSVSPLFESPG
jgi:hypothetical protein